MIAAAYAVAAGLVVFWPTPVGRGLNPLIFTVLHSLSRMGAPSWVDYSLMQNLANVLLFLPVGLLITLILPRSRWWLAIVLGCALSGFIELAQLLFLPERHASLVDVATNTTGTVLGCLLALAILRWFDRRPGRGQRHADARA